jgi:hypothetical protein
MDVTDEFTVDPRDRRRGLMLTALVGLPLVGAFGLYIQYRLRTPWVWLWVGVAVAVAAVRIGLEARPDGIVLRLTPEAMTLRFGTRETRMPWSEVRAMALSRRGQLMIKPGPGLAIPGRWEQRWWARGLFGILPFRSTYPRWSSGVRDWVTVLQVGWFPEADQERLVALATRYAGSTA